MLTVLTASTATRAASAQDSSRALGFEFLQGDEPLLSPQPTQVFMPSGQLAAASNKFEGVLTLNPQKALSRIEIFKDTFEIAANESLKLTELPPFSISLVSDGTTLIPLERGPKRTNHPYWELIVEPGKSWDMFADHGWSRAVLPFTLKEKNQNCTHNGLMTFLYRSDGSSSRAAWQITSETCLYFKANLWGTVEAEYEPKASFSSAEAIAAHRKEMSNRLPVKPISDLALDQPSLDPKAFYPPGIDDVSVYGFVLNGTHYRSDCPTRYGPYPFCDVLDLPSYSLAKSIFASLAYQLLINRWPDFATSPVSELLPQCKTPDKRWDDVLPIHLLNMTTGNYDSQVVNVDDDAEKMQAFFLAESNDDKTRISCEAWPRKSKPGTQWAYHTSDTYLLGAAMNSFLKQKLGSDTDIYRDLLYPQVIEHLNLSPDLRWTQRTYDESAQPFTGYGLIFNADDIARLAAALNSDQSINQYLVAADFDRTHLRSMHESDAMYDGKVAYSRGFWGVNASRWMPCQDTTWIPFMSGYGGISVAMFPGGGVYYYFTDSNQHGFRTAAEEANKALNYCKE